VEKFCCFLGVSEHCQKHQRLTMDKNLYFNFNFFFLLNFLGESVGVVHAPSPFDWSPDRR